MQPPDPKPPMRSSPSQGELTLEMLELAREERGLIQRVRIEWLQQQLRRSELAVRQSRAGLWGDRMVLVLEIGWTLTAHLERPERRRVAALIGFERRDLRGWVVRGRSPSGDVVTCEARSASLTLSR